MGELWLGLFAVKPAYNIDAQSGKKASPHNMIAFEKRRKQFCNLQ